MKKSWFHGLVLSLGLISSTAMGQYPAGYNNSFGPSAYPVQGQSMLQNLPQVPNAYAAQRAPTTPYQLVGTQEQVYGNPIAPSMTPPPAFQQAPAAQAPFLEQYAAPPQPLQQHAPMQQHAPQQHLQQQQQPHVHQHAAPMQQQSSPMPAPAYAGGDCQSCAQPTVNYGAQQQQHYGYQSVAPNCTSCGPAPVSQFYAQNFAPSHGVAAPLGQAKPWFFGGGVLLFNRIDDKNVPLSFQDSAYSADILGTRDARPGVAPGVEATIGRYFNCGRNALAVTYWGIFPDDTEALRTRPTGGDYRSRMPFSYMDIYSPGTTTPYAGGVYGYYDNAFSHAVQRSSTIHNLEVNLLGFAVGNAARNFNQATTGSLFSGTRGHRGGGSACGYCGGAGCGSCSSSCESNCGSCNTCAPTKYATGPCCLTAPSCGSRLNFSWLAGLRWFRFQDNLTYAASLNDSVIDRSADDIYYDVNTNNDLVGFQAGGRLDYCIGKRLNLYGNSRVGIFNNRSTLDTRLGTDFAIAYLNDTRTPANPDNGASYMFSETRNNVAFLSELGTGLGYRVSSKWTATVGYRAIIATGVATAPGNVRESFANFDQVRNFNNCGTLVLHGVNIGALYNF